MKPITFCIPSAKNEKEYTLLLLKSLRENTNIDLHEILVFIDSDNQDTYSALLDEQKLIKNLKIYRNTTDYPIGGQRNISIMFNNATNDIVCYLQSDMVVSKNIDKYIDLEYTDSNSVLSLTRIEPPLHPESPDKIVYDFGIKPDTFKYNEFIEYANKVIDENRPQINNIYFAPFVVDKNLWFNVLNGFDTQFRCSREDSDFMLRCKLNGVKLIQTWKAIVYHFTCVSSRGKDWFVNNDDGSYKREIQNYADREELYRFIRKWGKFTHDIEHKYNVSIKINLDVFIDVNLLTAIEPYFTKLYINNDAVKRVLIDLVEFNSHYYSNLRWKYTYEYWQSVKHKYNVTDFNDKIIYDNGKTINDEILIKCDYSDLKKNIQQYIVLFENLSDVINDSDIGEFEYLGLRVLINKKTNQIDKLKKLEPNNNIDYNEYKFN